MASRIRIRRVLALALVLTLAVAAAARGDAAMFRRVSDAYVANAARLEPCTFSQADLESALEGIPPEYAAAVPDLRRAIEDGIAAHRAGDCRGIEPTGGVATTTTPADVSTTAAPGSTTTTPGATAATPGATATTPGATATTPGTETGVAPPPAATPTTPSSTPLQVTTTPGVQPPPVKRDARPLLVGAIALGAVLLLALLAWGWGRLRGWDPPWAQRARHAWGEAGYRVTTTWAEFTDWLRLGR